MRREVRAGQRHFSQQLQDGGRRGMGDGRQGEEAPLSCGGLGQEALTKADLCSSFP